MYQLSTEIWLPRPIEEVFAFFSDVANLNLITPPWLRFVILTQPPIAMRPGAIVEYQLRLHGVPIRWRTEISVWEPPRRFVDEQRRGPYRVWIHEHSFTERDGGTLVTDRVRYSFWGGAIAHKLLVQPDLRKIFDYRAHSLRSIFQAEPGGSHQEPPV